MSSASEIWSILTCVGPQLILVGRRDLDAIMAVYDLENILNCIRRDELVERSLAPEEVLFHQGSRIQSIHVVVEGEVRAETYLDDGRSTLFYPVQNGGALSEENLYFPTHLYTGVASPRDHHPRHRDGRLP